MTLGGKYNGLWIGKSGSRKTTALASLPKPLLIVGFESRFDHLLLRFPHYKDDITIENFRRGQAKDLRGKLKSLREYCEYRSVAFDSLTSLANLSIYDSREDVDSGKVRLGFKMPNPDDYNFESTVIFDVISTMDKLTAHTVLTAHFIAVEKKDPIQPQGQDMMNPKMRTEYTLMTAGKKIAQMIPGYFNEVYFFQTEAPMIDGADTICKVFTDHTIDADGKFNCKTSLPLPKVIDWTGKEFWPCIEENLEKYKIKMISEPQPERPSLEEKEW